MLFYYTLVDLDSDKSKIFQIEAKDEFEAENKLFKKMFPYVFTSKGTLSDINTMIEISANRMFQTEPHEYVVVV